MKFEVRHNTGVVVEEVAGRARRLRDLTPVLEDMGEHMVNSSIPENFQAGGRPGRWPRSDWSSEKGQLQSGRLLRSIRHEVSRGRLEVGTNAKYANQRQFGGTIKAKGKLIPVPIPGLPVSMSRPSRWGARLRWRPTRKGRGALVARTRGKKWRVIFWLKEEVTQPARPFLLFQDADLAYLATSVARHLGGGR